MEQLVTFGVLKRQMPQVERVKLQPRPHAELAGHGLLAGTGRTGEIKGRPRFAAARLGPPNKLIHKRAMRSRCRRILDRTHQVDHAFVEPVNAAQVIGNPFVDPQRA